MKELDKDALLEEAIKRGYGKGIKIKAYFPEYSSAYSDNREYIMNDCKPSYEEKEKAIRMGGSIIYHKGKWAEIVEKPKVETKFEKGKWYYYEHGENGKDKYYLKYDKHNSDNFYYIEYIKLMKNAKAIRQVSNISFKFMYNIKEVPLSEIQQYLPDGHPDKIKEVKEEVKSVEEWSVGSYAVALINAVNYYSTKKGDIYLIRKNHIADNLTNGNTDLTFILPRDPEEFKWFPTLQEAQKFSDELLGKSKTGLSRKDLIDGEFYKVEVDDGFLIMKLSFKGSDLNRVNAAYVSNMDSEWRFRQESTPWLTNRKITKADFSEVRWLKTCIKQDKFIEQSELNKYDDEGNLMGSKEYPEYYECIEGNCVEFTKGRIYKIVNSKNLEDICNFVDNQGKKDGWAGDNYKHFKPSTREAYEAQFKKDEEFKVGDVLYIMNSKKNRDKYPQCIGTLITIRSISEDTYTPDSYWISYTPERFGGGGCRVYGNGLKPGVDIRKVLPHEIPVENTIKKYPITFKESFKYTIGADPITAQTWAISDYGVSVGSLLDKIKLNWNSSEKITRGLKKSPDLIDKSKVEVKIKRTKVKQIKL